MAFEPGAWQRVVVIEEHGLAAVRPTLVDDGADATGCRIEIEMQVFDERRIHDLEGPLAEREGASIQEVVDGERATGPGPEAEVISEAQ